MSSFRYYLQFAADAAETEVNMHNLKIAHNAMNVIAVLFTFTSCPRIPKKLNASFVALGCFLFLS